MRGNRTKGDERRGNRTGGYRKDRPRPTAYLNGNPEAGMVRSTGRTIILSTGRGCVSITPDEALALARELTAAAQPPENL